MTNSSVNTGDYDENQQKQSEDNPIVILGSDQI